MNSKKCIRLFIKKYSFDTKKDFRSKFRYFDFIFLCGKKISNYVDNRSIISNALSYDQKFCFYAENYHDGLPNNYDLLTKETIYQDLSIAVIIIVESLGSACELGAFTYYKNNIDKVWVINDIKYQNDESFIDKGPISKIKQFDSKHVIYVNKNSNDLIELSSKNYKDLQNINKTTTLKKNAIDLNNEDFLIINDLKLLVYYIFDYLLIFKCLILKNIYLDLKIIFKKKRIILNLSDGTTIDSRKEINLILKNILSIMREAGLIYKSNNKDIEYYGLNNDLIYSKFSYKNNLPHVIFKNNLYLNSNFVHDISHIYNVLKKEGFTLWKKNC